MLRIFYIIAFLWLASGCVTQRRCLDKFPPDTVTVTNVEYRDTTVNVTINKLPPKSYTASINSPLIIRYGAVTVRTLVRNDTIYTYLSSIDTTLQVRLDSAIKVISSQKEVIFKYKERYIPKWIAGLANLGGLVVIAFILFIIFEIRKR